MTKSILKEHQGAQTSHLLSITSQSFFKFSLQNSFNTAQAEAVEIIKHDEIWRVAGDETTVFPVSIMFIL